MGIEARKILVIPPITNIEMNTGTKSIRVRNSSLPSHDVASQEKILTPIGMAVVVDEIM
jgi:hypothetical protein